MLNDSEILRRVVEKVGLSMTKSVDYDILAQAIKDKTNQTLGVNTLKRLFGYKTDKVVPRVSTMEIIAQYLDFPDYKSLIKDIGVESDISIFTPIDRIEVAELKKGTLVRICYEPNRILLLTYLGNMNFIVNEVDVSQNLEKGDILTITQLIVGHRLVMVKGTRDGEDLGLFETSKFGELKSVEIIY